MKDLNHIAIASGIPEIFFKGSLGLFTLMDEVQNPNSYYHRITPLEKRIMDTPDLDKVTDVARIHRLYLDNQNAEQEFRLAILTKWITVCSTTDQLLEPLKIAFDSEFYQIAQIAARKFYALS